MRMAKSKGSGGKRRSSSRPILPMRKLTMKVDYSGYNVFCILEFFHQSYRISK